MTTKSQKEIAEIKHTITSTMGEFRIHLITSRAGTGCTARLWHPDGMRVGHAGGGGYDRQGAALGQAIEMFFREELLALVPARFYDMVPNSDGLSGLTHFHHPRRKEGSYNLSKRLASLDGSCGLSCMLRILEALGFASVRELSTGKLSTLILATGLKTAGVR